MNIFKGMNRQPINRLVAARARGKQERLRGGCGGRAVAGAGNRRAGGAGLAMKTSEILFKAREIQLERGRAVNSYEDDCGRVCMIGAIRLACNVSTNEENCIAARLATEYVRKVVKHWLVCFSDDDCETVDDMAAAFEIAACCAAAEGN